MNAKAAQKWVLGGLFGLCVAALLAPAVLISDIEQREDKYKVLRFEVLSKRSPDDVANCLGQLSAGGFSLGNEKNGYSRGRNISELLFGSKVDADKPLVNGFRRIEVHLSPFAGGTRLSFFSRPERTISSGEKAVLARCLAVAPSEIDSGTD